MLAALLALSGCKLIDQTTFDPAPPPMAPPPMAAIIAAPAAADARRALLVIGPGAAPSSYAPVLGLAVQAAERRDPGVRFDVTAIAAPAPARETDAAETEALAVMRAIAAAGVPVDRILLRAALVPGLSRHEVRVYVR